MRSRAWLVPEVVQTSAMDCGPASLKALLDGHRIPVSYGRLREACQTDIDGTSIDTLEDTAVRLGLEAAQVMTPIDHVALREAATLPCLAVVRQPSGATHFVIAWRRHGPWMQVMDPGVGRRFVPLARFLSELYVHSMSVPAAAWREFAGSDAFLAPLGVRMHALGIPPVARREWMDRALADASWEPLARLDAAVRMLTALARADGIRRGRMATTLLAAFMSDQNGSSAVDIPEAYWTVRRDPHSASDIRLTGAVMITVSGARDNASPASLTPELAAALNEPPSRPGRDLWRLARADGAFSSASLCFALALAAGGLVIEALLLRGLFDLARELTLSGQRVGALSAVAAFLGLMLVLERSIAGGLLRLGRTLEGRLRLAFLSKIPRLGDRYFHSRLISDMAERSHSVHVVRTLPELAGNLARTVFEMALTIAAIVWLFPGCAFPAMAIGIVAMAIPFAAQPTLAARDLKWRTHTGALSRFYFDAMRGLVAVRAHGAERALRREQEPLLREWARAGLHMQKAVVTVEGMQLVGGFAMAASLLMTHVRPDVEPGGLLLLAYWTLSLPVLGQEIGAAAWQYPRLRNITLRLLEPLGAPDEHESQSADRLNAAPTTNRCEPRGVSIELKNVTVRAGGHQILDGVNLSIQSGEHVAIVGASGAGKSSLVGLLLGWHRASDGDIVVDGARVDDDVLASIRRDSAWVDPQVQLWNRTLLDNLRYGSGDNSDASAGAVVEQANLRQVLRRLPNGLQSVIGEGGALVSGGEGQRMRFGRALSRGHVRLAILDEPARGLGREQRRALIDRARDTWATATLLCITHDVEDTLGFDRVLVVEDGRIVEDGRPRELAASLSRYRALLDAEQTVRRGLWSGPVWRRVTVADGQLLEDQFRGATCSEYALK